jgi:hypothetical protein
VGVACGSQIRVCPLHDDAREGPVLLLAAGVVVLCGMHDPRIYPDLMGGDDDEDQRTNATKVAHENI